MYEELLHLLQVTFNKSCINCISWGVNERVCFFLTAEKASSGAIPWGIISPDSAPRDPIERQSRLSGEPRERLKCSLHRYMEQKHQLRRLPVRPRARLDPFICRSVPFQFASTWTSTETTAPTSTGNWCSSFLTTSAQLPSMRSSSRRFRPAWTARTSLRCCCHSCRASHTQGEKLSEVNERAVLRASDCSRCRVNSAEALKILLFSSNV